MNGEETTTSNQEKPYDIVGNLMIALIIIIVPIKLFLTFPLIQLIAVGVGMAFVGLIMFLADKERIAHERGMEALGNTILWTIERDIPDWPKPEGFTQGDTTND